MNNPEVEVYMLPKYKFALKLGRIPLVPFLDYLGVTGHAYRLGFVRCEASIYRAPTFAYVIRLWRILKIQRAELVIYNPL